MLADRTLAARRSRRATDAAIRGLIFTLGFISTLRASPGSGPVPVPPRTLYTIYTVIQINVASLTPPHRAGRLHGDAVRYEEGTWSKGSLSWNDRCRST